MNLNHFYSKLLIAGIISLNFGFLSAVVHKPKGDGKESIKLIIKGKDRIYYELDEAGLNYSGVGNQFEKEDSICIGIYSRTIKAPTGKKNRNYGFTIQIDDGIAQKLKYKKPGSNVISADRPGWNYTQAGVWYIYLPVKEKGYKIKVESLKGNPVVYMRLTSHKLIKKGEYIDIIKTVNRHDRWRIETQKESNSNIDMITTYWYLLQDKRQQQFEISGPASVRVFTRVQFENGDSNEDYYIRIREDGYDLGTFYFHSKRSNESYVAKTNKSVGKWRTMWLTIPSGKHYYTFTLPNIDDNLEKSVFIRMKKWEEQ